MVLVKFPGLCRVDLMHRAGTGLLHGGNFTLFPSRALHVAENLSIWENLVSWTHLDIAR